MLKIKPQFVLDEKNKQRGVILNPRDFKRLIETLEDYDDHKVFIERKKQLENKKNKGRALISHKEVGKILFGNDT